MGSVKKKIATFFFEENEFFGGVATNGGKASYTDPISLE